MSFFQRNKLAIVAIGLASAAIGLVLWVGHEDQETIDAAAKPQTAKPIAAGQNPAGAMRGLFWPSEQKLTFATELSLGLHIEGQPAFDVQISGDLDLIAAEPTRFEKSEPGDALVLFAQLRGVEVKVLGKAQESGEQEAFVRAFSQPLAARLDDEGFVRGFRVQPSEMPAATQALKDLLMALSIHDRVDQATQWQATEVDASGSYVATYVRPHPGELTRVKGPYQAILRQVPPGFAYKEASSQAKITYDSRFALTHFEFDETRQAATHGALAGARSSFRFSLKRTALAPARDLLAGLALRWSALEVAEIHETASKSTREHQRDVAWLKGMSAEQIIRGIEVLDGSKSDEERRELGEIYLAAVSLIRLDEKARDEFLKRAKAGGPKASVYVDALGDSGDLAALKGLVALSREPTLAVPARQQAIRVMGSRGVPDAELVEDMLALTRDPELGETATFALGSLIGNAREQGAAIHAEVGPRLVESFKNATDSNSQIHWLGALANAGYRGAWAELEPLFSSPSASSRRMGIAGANKIVGEDVTQALIKLVRYDIDSNVRDDALRVLQSREFGPAIREVTLDALLHDASRVVRGSAASAILSWRKALREEVAVVAALAYAREHDEDSEVRGLLRG